MKHTQGEIHGGKASTNEFDLFDNSGHPVCRISTMGPQEENHERIKALWNAANDMTTERAVILLERGDEMAIMLSEVVRWIEDSGTDARDMKALLVDMEGK